MLKLVGKLMAGKAQKSLIFIVVPRAEFLEIKKKKSHNNNNNGKIAFS